MNGIPRARLHRHPPPCQPKRRAFQLARKGRGKSSRERKPPRTPRTERRSNRPQRKKVCHFCKEKLDYVDFKDLSVLRKYINDRGRIRARRVTGTCPKHQALVASAVKNAREVALIPYVVR